MDLSWQALNSQSTAQPHQSTEMTLDRVASSLSSYSNFSRLLEVGVGKWV